MKAKNKIPKHNDATLKAEILNLKSEIADLKTKLKILGGIEDKCPSCGKPKGNFVYQGQSEIIKQIRATVNHFSCDNCGHKYEKQPYPQ